MDKGASIALNNHTVETLSAALKTLAGQTGAQEQADPGDVTDPVVPAQLITRVVELTGGLGLLAINAEGPQLGKFESFDDAV